MPIRSLSELKEQFLAGKVPTQGNFLDLIDTLASANTSNQDLLTIVNLQSAGLERTTDQVSSSIFPGQINGQLIFNLLIRYFWQKRTLLEGDQPIDPEVINDRYIALNDAEMLSISDIVDAMGETPEIAKTVGARLTTLESIDRSGGRILANTLRGQSGKTELVFTASSTYFNPSEINTNIGNFEVFLSRKNEKFIALNLHLFVGDNNKSLGIRWREDINKELPSRENIEDIEIKVYRITRQSNAETSKVRIVFDSTGSNDYSIIATTLTLSSGANVVGTNDGEPSDTVNVGVIFRDEETSTVTGDIVHPEEDIIVSNENTIATIQTDEQDITNQTLLDISQLRLSPFVFESLNGKYQLSGISFKNVSNSGFGDGRGAQQSGEIGDKFNTLAFGRESGPTGGNIGTIEDDLRNVMGSGFSQKTRGYYNGYISNAGTFTINTSTIFAVQLCISHVGERVLINTDNDFEIFIDATGLLKSRQGLTGLGTDIVNFSGSRTYIECNKVYNIAGIFESSSRRVYLAINGIPYTSFNNVRTSSTISNVRVGGRNIGITNFIYGSLSAITGSQDEVLERLALITKIGSMQYFGVDKWLADRKLYQSLSTHMFSNNMPKRLFSFNNHLVNATVQSEEGGVIPFANNTRNSRIGNANISLILNIRDFSNFDNSLLFRGYITVSNVNNTTKFALSLYRNGQNIITARLVRIENHVNINDNNIFHGGLYALNGKTTSAIFSSSGVLDSTISNPELSISAESQNFNAVNQVLAIRIGTGSGNNWITNPGGISSPIAITVDSDCVSNISRMDIALMGITPTNTFIQPIQYLDTLENIYINNQLRQ